LAEPKSLKPVFSEQRSSKAKNYRIAAYLLFITGVIFSLSIWNLTRQELKKAEQTRLQHNAEMVRVMIEEHLDDHIAVLHGMRAFIDSSEQVTRDEWRRYIHELQMGRQFHGVHAYSFVRYLPRQKIDSYLARIRENDLPDFTIETSGDQPHLAVVEYIEPFLHNRSALGKDLAQNAVKNQAMINAVEYNRATLSGLTTHSYDEKERPGFALLLPVYAVGKPLGTVAERWQALIGWVGNPIDIDTLLSQIATSFKFPIDIEIFDGDPDSAEHLIYDDDGQLRTSLDASPDLVPKSGHFRLIEIDIAGRTWYLNVISLPADNSLIGGAMPMTLLIFGLLLSLAAAMLVASYGRPLEKAQVLAEKMTVDLRENEERLQSMFRDHDAVMLLISPESRRIIDANEAASRFYGYHLDALRGMAIDNIQVSDDTTGIPLSNGSDSGKEIKHRLASGETRDVEVHSSTIKIKEETVLFSVIHDVTPKKISRQALADSEKSYRLLFDEAAHGAAVADVETGIILACNLKLAQMLGRNVEEIVGQHQSFLHPIDEGNETESFQTHRDENPGQLIPDQLLTKSGELIDVEIKTNRIIFNDRQALNGYFYDITDRKRAEKSLRESETMFRQVFEMNPDPVILTRMADKEILNVNKAFENITRISKFEALGNNFDQLDLWADNNRRSSFWKQLDRDHEINSFEAEFKLPGNHLKTGLFSARLFEIQEEPSVMISIRDITTEKKAEQGMLEMDQMKNEFISTAAHELRTPLSAIMGFTELLYSTDQFGQFSPEQVQEFLKEIYERGEALSRIIDDLLDISRIESGRSITLNLHSTDFVEVLKKAADFFRLHDKGHSYRLEIPEHSDSQKVRIDHQRINQVLENLLSNAAKYSPEETDVTIRAFADEGKWQVEVEDRGIGMSPEEIERVFDKFYRVNASNTSIGGLGIGMYIARQIIDSHGGNIWIESEPGSGTKVCFTIPFSSPNI